MDGGSIENVTTFLRTDVSVIKMINERKSKRRQTNSR